MFKFSVWGMSKKKPNDPDDTSDMAAAGLGLIGTACLVTGPVGWAVGAGIIGSMLAWDALAVTCEGVGKLRAAKKQSDAAKPKAIVLTLKKELPPPVITREELFAQYETAYKQEIKMILRLPLTNEEKEIVLEQAKNRFLEKTESLMN